MSASRVHNEADVDQQMLALLGVLVDNSVIDQDQAQAVYDAGFSSSAAAGVKDPSKLLVGQAPRGFHGQTRGSASRAPGPGPAAGTSRGVKRSASEVLPPDADSDLDSHESPEEPKSYSCAYAGNENMTGCVQVAVYYAKGKSNKLKGWHRVCRPCFKWLVTNGSLWKEEATTKLDD